MVLRPKTDVVLPEFLPFFMQSDLFMNRALEISVGSLSPTINWTHTGRTRIRPAAAGGATADCGGAVGCR